MLTEPLQLIVLILPCPAEMLGEVFPGVSSTVVHREPPLRMPFYPHIPVDDISGIVACSTSHDQVLETVKSPVAGTPADEFGHVLLPGDKIASECTFLQWTLNQGIHLFHLAGQLNTIVNLADIDSRVGTYDICGRDIHLPVRHGNNLSADEVLPCDCLISFYTLPRKHMK